MILSGFLLGTLFNFDECRGSWELKLLPLGLITSFKLVKFIFSSFKKKSSDTVFLLLVFPSVLSCSTADLDGIPASLFVDMFCKESCTPSLIIWAPKCGCSIDCVHHVLISYIKGMRVPTWNSLFFFSVLINVLFQWLNL